MICYECEAETCEVGPIYLRECEEESSVCVLFKDFTGKALQKGKEHVYRRECGAATYPNNKSEWNCTQYTKNFDKCLCRADLCNGDPTLMDLVTTTQIPVKPTTENEESGERKPSNASAKMLTGRKLNAHGDYEDEDSDSSHKGNSGKKTKPKKCSKSKTNSRSSSRSGSGSRRNKGGRKQNRNDDYSGDAYGDDYGGGDGYRDY